MSGKNSFSGSLDPALGAGWGGGHKRMGFFTDTSICIGCKACEVACKEWNAVPEDGLLMLGSSYDNSGSLGASTWRHVKFVEQAKSIPGQETGLVGQPVGASIADVLNRTADSALLGDRTALGTTMEHLSVKAPVDLGMPTSGLPGQLDGAPRSEFRWLMESDVCKHCTNAGCMDACPTGALIRAASAASGSVVPGRTSSIATMAPRPRTSPICGCSAARECRRDSITSPMACARVGRSSCAMAEMAARAAAQAIGLPP